jgi:hypothetical protein
MGRRNGDHQIPIIERAEDTPKEALHEQTLDEAV